jgi:predicted acylesterase/phospholipase RssA
VTIGGRRLVDGAVAANTPVPQAEDLGATDIYVLAVATSGRSDGSTAPAETAPCVSRNLLDAGTARHHQGPQASVHFIPSPPSPTSNILDFRHTSHLMAESYRLTRQWLAQIPPEATAA